MRILKFLFFFLLLLIVAFLVLGLVMPKDYKVERHKTIAASKDAVWQHISTLEAQHKWSPWMEMEPTAINTYEGTPGSVGSKNSWEGKIVGKGAQTIAATEVNTKLETKLHFMEPMESESDAYLLLNDEAGKTKVTWGLKGTNPFPWNAMGVFFNMDKMIGKDYEHGLNKLDKLVLSTPVAQPAKVDTSIVQ